VITQAEEPERPKAVTVIGWVWAVLGGVLALKALLNLVTWSILHSTAPALLKAFGEQFAHVPLVQMILQHAGAVLASQASFWALVSFCAWNFLRLRPWARLAIQAVCCLGLVYAAGLLVFWVQLWRKTGLAMRDPSLTESHRSLALFAGIAACILLGSLFGLMLGFLQSSPLRKAFAKPSGQAPSAVTVVR
jgi:hypothetical protein